MQNIKDHIYSYNLCTLVVCTKLACFIRIVYTKLRDCLLSQCDGICVPYRAIELANSIETDHPVSIPSCSHSPLFLQEYAQYHLGKSFYDLREFQRAAHALRACKSDEVFFLRCYCLYLVRRCVVFPCLCHVYPSLVLTELVTSDGNSHLGYKSIARVLQECYKSVTRMSQEC